MLRVGTVATQQAFHRCLVTPGHRREIHVLVMDLDGNLRKHATFGATNRVLSGSEVTFDVKRTPRRILTLNLLDPRGEVSWTPNSRVVQVIDSRYVSELGEWVDVEVFTGIIQPESTRTGASLRLVAHGMEVQAMGALWKRRVFRKKRRKTWIIKELLGEVGEIHLGGIPDLDRTTRRRIVVGPHDAVWPKVKRIAASMNYVVFYDGRARPIMRKRGGRPVLTIDGAPVKGNRPFFPALLSDMEVGEEGEQPNTFEVSGKDPTGPTKPPRAVVKLPPAHPNSPRSRARNGKHFHEVRSEEREHAKTKAECREIARRWRREAMKETKTFGFECLPIPHLEEYDAVRVRTRFGNFTVRMREWTLPLHDEGAPTMKVGSRKVQEARF